MAESEENLWRFAPGEKHDIPQMTLTLNELEPELGRGHFTMHVNHLGSFSDYLYLEKPVVALKSRKNGEPAISFVLQRIEDGCAFVRVWGHQALAESQSDTQ